MSNWKTIAGGILALVAISTIGSSAMMDDLLPPRTTDQVIFGAATFLSVIILQWLSWRFIVPAHFGPLEATSFFQWRARRDFFSGTIAFGYVQIAIYCLEFSGYLLRSDPRGRIGFLVMGLVLIALGMAARLRRAFLALTYERSKPIAEVTEIIAGSPASGEHRTGGVV
jgi:hypothetical protein